MKIPYSLILSLLFSTLINAQQTTKYIVVDQFGYRSESNKIAVIRNPQTGYDASETFTPGATYQVINRATGNVALSGAPSIWNNGQEDPTSGDKAWWFNFSSLETPGNYYILDVDNNVRSFEFEIADDIYEEILKQAVRTFFYQRVGFAKETPYADAGWTDGASHIGPLQDKNCRYYRTPNDASSEKDLSGGWYDAGDYNKYTNWTADYIIQMLKAYKERPDAFGDDYNIPESGNGMPDILDEAKWGMDHLLRLQNNDGSAIAVVSLSHASPPSSANGQSLYGGVNTSATLSSAAAFAYGAKVYGELGYESYSETLTTAAEKAWEWADANPEVVWRNNDERDPYNSKGIGSGQQEVEEYGRLTKKLRAAINLYSLTGEVTYKNFFESNYAEIHMIAWPYVYPYELEEQETLLYATTLDGISSSIKNDIINKYNSSMNSSDIAWKAFDNTIDPYMGYLDSYTWGSNNTKARQGLMYYDVLEYGLNTARNTDAIDASENYIHYLHGVNPMNLVYLSNMYDYNAENCVNEFYHSWFKDKSALWDRVGVSTFGPAPGFLTGGPNSSYDVDGCCPSGCGGTGNNALCTSEDVSPPKDQPQQKSYKDFNSNWPLNSWSVTENSCGYQINYIRLLSKFVSGKLVDCSNNNCVVTGNDGQEEYENTNNTTLYPNPAKETVFIQSEKDINQWELIDIDGNVLRFGKSSSINIIDLKPGQYFVKIDRQKTLKLIKE